MVRLHRIISSLHRSWSRVATPLQPSLPKKGHHLFGIERPVQLGAVVTAPQHRNDQAITLELRLALGDVDQLYQQAMIDQRHQHSLGHFAEVAAEGAEQLTFRQHVAGPGLAYTEAYSRRATPTLHLTWLNPGW